MKRTILAAGAALLLAGAVTTADAQDRGRGGAPSVGQSSPSTGPSAGSGFSGRGSVQSGPSRGPSVGANPGSSGRQWSGDGNRNWSGDRGRRWSGDNNRWRGRSAYRNRGPNVGFYFGAPYYDYGYINPCWETRRVWTSRGWRLRRVWVCY